MEVLVNVICYLSVKPFIDEDMLMFSSPGQLNLLKKCTHIISDGTFKYAPKGTFQIYRVFGLIRGLHATPLVTSLFKGKPGILYKKMWEKCMLTFVFPL